MRTKTANDQPRGLSGLGEVAGLYDGFILDLWGVVHDGLNPYADTIATLQELKRAGRIVWMLSNAPRRAHIIAEKLSSMGIGSDLYDGLLTSGEATWMALKERYLEQWGRKCFHLGPPEKDASLYENLDIDIVKEPAQADFVLNSGVHDFDDTAEQYIPVLTACADAGLPMLCANPDRIVHVGDKLVICPGTFADMYTEMDGQVVYYGKPYASVYNLVLAQMGVKKVMAVGDAMVTDIAGATGAGLDSALVTSGIHRDAFTSTADAQNYPVAAQGFFHEYPYRPTYLMSALRW